VLEDAYLSPPPTDNNQDSLCGFHVQYLYELNVKHAADITEDITDTSNKSYHGLLFSNEKLKDLLRDLHNKVKEERFTDFYIEKIISPYYGAFMAGQRVKDPKIHK